MKRKVVQHGPSSLIISLPSEWVKKNGVRKGDDLDVTESNNIIEISTKPLIKDQSVTIDVSGLNRTSILLYLLSMYRRGYKEINIKFNNTSSQHYRTGHDVPVLSVIQDVITRFIGVEIIKQSKDFVQIKQISEDSEKDFDMLIRRVLFLTVEAFKEFENGVIEENEQLVNVTETHYITIRKFINYCIRLIHEGAVTQTAKALTLMTILSGMDRIIKSLKQFGREKRDRRIKLSRKVIPVTKEVRESMELFQKFFLSKDLKLLDNIESKRQNIKKQIFNIKLDSDSMLILDFFKITVETIQDMVEGTLRL